MCGAGASRADRNTDVVHHADGRLGVGPGGHGGGDGALRPGRLGVRAEQAPRVDDHLHGREDGAVRARRDLPAGIAFDVPFGGMSWMDYIAKGGYDVWLRGRSRLRPVTRPPAMDEPPRRTPHRHHRGGRPRRRRGRRLHPAGPHRFAAQPDRLVVGHGDDGVDTSRNNAKVEKLVLYAPVWIRQTPSLVQAGPGPVGAYRTVEMSAARARWLSGVAPEKQRDLIPPGGGNLGRRDAQERPWRHGAEPARPACAERRRGRRPALLGGAGRPGKMPYSAADIRVPTLPSRRSGTSIRPPTWPRRSSRC